MTTWVLLRGLTRERGHWGDFTTRLQVALAADVLPLDLPGNGARWAERSPVSIEAMADDCRAQLERLGLREPVGVVALSMGAMVASHWARSDPQTVRHLVLIGASLRSLAPLHWRMRPLAAARLLFRLLRGEPRRLEETVLELTSARADTSVIPHWLALRASHPITRANALRQLLAAARFRAPPAPALPVLLLAGCGDRLVDHRCSERIAAAWECPLALHPWAGHDVPLDDADWVIGQLRSWINPGEHGSGPSST